MWSISPQVCMFVENWKKNSALVKKIINDVDAISNNKVISNNKAVEKS